MPERDTFTLEKQPASASMDLQEFIDRFRDISFSKEDFLDPSFETVEHILRDAGIQDHELDLVNIQVLLKDWHEAYLTELTDAMHEEKAGLSNSTTSQRLTRSAVNYDTKMLRSSLKRRLLDDDGNSYQQAPTMRHLNNCMPLPVQATPFSSVKLTADSTLSINESTCSTQMTSLSNSQSDSDSSTRSANQIPSHAFSNELYTGIGDIHIQSNVQTHSDSQPCDSKDTFRLENGTYDDLQDCNETQELSDCAHEECNHRQMESNYEMQQDSDGSIDNPENLSADNQRIQAADAHLDQRWWDRFQMIPREQVSNSATFRTLFKFFKIVCYLFLLVIVLGAAVTNKLCILLMTSGITKDPIAEVQWPAKTMLVISMCFPYAVWLLVYTGKTLFGSHTWPSFSLLAVVLLFELLHTLGLCLLVFRVLPLLDLLSALIVMSSIYVVPGFLKTIFEGRDPSLRMTRKCSLFLLNFGAFLIQLGSITLCVMFQINMDVNEKDGLRNTVIRDNTNVIAYRTPLEFRYFSGNFLFELPLSLLLISFSYWENYTEGDFVICGKLFTFNAWKKHLHHSKGRLYIIGSVWKVMWVVVFAIVLQPGFNFNLQYTQTQRVISTPVTTLTPRSTMQTTSEKLETTIQFVTTFNNESFTTDHRHRRQVEDAIENNTQGDVSSVFEDQEPGRSNTKQDDSENMTETEEHESQRMTQTLQLITEETQHHFKQYGILYVQIIANILLSYFSSIACKMCMQLMGFSLPLCLTTPVCVAIVVLQSKYEFLSTGSFVWVGLETEGNAYILHLAWLGVLWLSELFIISHIWFPSNGRMEKVERLFVTPTRCSILADQSLMLRRRRNDQDVSLIGDKDDDSIDPDADVYKAGDIVPQIYACATMWHETRDEMTNLLKSIFRMDIDHSGRYLAQKFLKIRDPDYYEFEAHIFFDDAMELSDDDLLVPNMFVADLMDCIDDSLSSVHERQMSLGPPTRIPTPYGGRLTWRLPGGTKLIAHMKDKHKIRHKKRWSQVMYMYYLLGFRILAQPENLLTKEMVSGHNSDGDCQRVKLTESQLRKRRKAAHFTRSVIFNYVTDEVHNQAENTYILTLDGDVDFHPNAVRLLVDRLKRNKKVGAACGRIHPIGSGPLLWYQQFEYAIGHWLQKATEDVFGCVMCAPGCFSLFRGSALMDDNVARTYATRATEAGHYVQYDQGEDRWLSTLLLQQGYRIDYCAAADALTHAPETFSEFFNQRRRWGPSTLANIVDLLGSWKATIGINDNISTLYILYQFCMVASTILGPATILLMLSGAFNVVFKTTVIESYLMALLPAIFFIIVCIYCKPETQMTVAAIMSAIYAILMTVVLVGTVGQAVEGGVTSPNVIFLIMLLFVFFVSALMHPEEFACVIPGALYFICLPTGYLLLTIYYLSNMNTVSWGTREMPTRKTREQLEEEKQVAEEKRRKKEEKQKGMFGWFGLNGFFRELGEILRHVKSDDTRHDKSKTDELLRELIVEMRASRLPDNDSRVANSDGDTNTSTVNCVGAHVSGDIDQDKTGGNKHEPSHIPVWLQPEELDNPGWLQSDICGEGPIKCLSDRESSFWKQIIGKYLYPINEDKMHQGKVETDLINLRNNVVFGFFMTSALWIALSMQLQILQEELKDTLFFKIPRWNNAVGLAFEPLGLIFLIFFAIILCVQFLGMFAHRWGTLLHMLSITELSCGKSFTEKDKVRGTISKAMELQKLCNIENEPVPNYDEPLTEYAYSDDETDFDTLSCAETVSSWSVNQAAGYSGMPNSSIPARYNRKRDIFNRRGHSTSEALRKAFEKRYRNERFDQSSDTQSDIGVNGMPMYEVHDHDTASVV